MSEIQFAKSFLSTLDARPAKISLEHYEDPRTYPARTAYILPKNSIPLQKRERAVAGQEQTYNVTIKSARNPPLDISIPARSPTTSILSLKESVSESHAIPISAMRMLYKKKPVADSKVLKDLVGDEDVTDVEFGVMVIGGAAVVGTVPSASSANSTSTPIKQESDAMEVDAPDAQTTSKEYLKGTEFWNDLKAFLDSKVKDETMAGALHREFRRAYDTSEDFR